MEDNVNLNWRTSSYSGNGGGNCVEVADAGSRVMVRDTKHRGAGTLAFTADAWQTFTRSLRLAATDAGASANRDART
jgi:hypothetical protein